MNYLAYTPSVEAYIAVNRNGEKKYYDVSKDITNASVTRNENNPSEFSITLANKNRKYNGLFMPFDCITIYASKTERYRLLTGYITSVDVFKLYSGDFKIKGKCTLYTLQQKFWDKNLKASYELTNIEDMSIGDQSLSQVTFRLLTQVGGWALDSINISKDIPQQVISWARELYEAQKTDLDQGANVVDAFNKMLKESTSSVGGVSGNADSGRSSGGVALTGDEKKASAEQKKIVETATNGSVPGQYFYCLKWVGDVYQAAGHPFIRLPGAIDVWRQRESQTAYGRDKDKIPLGAAVITTGSGSDGYGHIGIYIGGGQVISEVGGQRTETLEGFCSWAGDTIDGMRGWCGWVCPDCGITWK